MRPTELLKEDHKLILRAIGVMGNVSDRIARSEQVRVEDLDRIVDFIRTFADKCHHGKEEDLLFVEMEKAGIPKEGGPIGVMLREHVIGRDYVKGMAEGISEIRAGKDTGPGKFAENATGYARLLTQHIDKEDNILYMMADMHMDEKVEKELLDAFEKVEEEVMGHGRHEEFHDLILRLESTYAR